MPTQYLFLLGLLAAHELDAVTCRQWRLLYVLRAMLGVAGKSGCIALHVPLFTALTSTAASAHPAAQAIRTSGAAHTVGVLQR